MGFVVDKEAVGHVFCYYSSFHRLLHSSSSIVRGWYNRPNSGRRTSWIQSHHTPRNYKRNVINEYHGIKTARFFLSRYITITLTGNVWVRRFAEVRDIGPLIKAFNASYKTVLLTAGPLFPFQWSVAILAVRNFLRCRWSSHVKWLVRCTPDFPKLCKVFVVGQTRSPQLF
jgi:hypothetical protein